MKDQPQKPLADVLLTVSEDASKIVEAMVEGARKFFEEDGEVPGAITAFAEGRDMPNVYPARHHNDTEKACVWAFLRFLRETHPIVLLISEIWVSKCDKGKDPYKQTRPANDPNRTEMVMISLWEKARTVWIAAAITRNPNHLGEFTVRYDTNDEECHVEGELAKGEHYQGKESYGRGR